MDMEHVTRRRTDCTKEFLSLSRTGKDLWQCMKCTRKETLGMKRYLVEELDFKHNQMHWDCVCEECLERWMTLNPRNLKRTVVAEKPGIANVK